jgi:hypothetical protein
MNKQIQSNLAAAIIYLGALSAAFALPRITTQPVDQFASLGPDVTFFVFASGIAPLSYQWRFNDTEIAGATKRTLVVPNIQLANAGSYTIVVTDTSGSVTSRVAKLDVDPTFTMITAGPVVNDTGTAVSAAWGDYNNDGFPDLLAGNLEGRVNFLYLNRRDGTFEQMLTNIIGGLDYGLGAWGDYDNDGFLDLYTVSPQNTAVHLYHNQGNGTLLKLTNAAVVGPIISDHHSGFSLAWGDYDNDGFLDMMVGNGRGGDGDFTPKPHFLFHNQGDGTFSKITSGSIVNDRRDTWSVTWADYDDDGRLDAFVANDLGENNQLYHNDGSGKFTALTAGQVGPLVNEGGDSRGAAWGDYDNDGHLDLFVSHGPKNLLYHNRGDGTFTKITSGAIVNDTTIYKSHGCSWVDYDNDGYLDLFAVQPGDNNFLYHNNGDGTFTRILTGNLVNHPPDAGSFDVAWADYDNDGFIDVFIANYGKNSLFHNNGNSNHWINLKLVGTASNRATIGAKVRIEATIGGKTFWQRRDISGGSSMAGQSDLRASFGLGDATNIDIVRIEWPSGTVQELHNIASKQFLTVTEPARLKGSVIGGQYQLVLNGGVGFTYDVQTSSNLVDWTSLTNIQTTNMAMPVSVDPVQVPQKYFRAVRQ